MIYLAHGFKNVTAKSHRDAAEKFGLTAARRTFGRRGRIAALSAGSCSADGTTREWSIFIGTLGLGRGTTGHTIHVVTQTK